MLRSLLCLVVLWELSGLCLPLPVVEPSFSGSSGLGCGEPANTSADPIGLFLASLVHQAVLSYITVCILCIYVCFLQSMAFVKLHRLFVGSELALLGPGCLLSAFFTITVVLSAYPPMFMLPLGGRSGTRKRISDSGEKTSQECSNVNVRVSQKRGASDDGDRNKHPKCGRPSKHHPADQCTPCQVWLQSGAQPELALFHTNVIKHAGDDWEEMSKYNTIGTVTITLNYDSCICKGCYRDFEKNHVSNCIPRWYKLVIDNMGINENKHCMLCCEVLATRGGNCLCKYQQWGSSSWHNDNTDELTHWKQFLEASGIVNYSIPAHVNHVCREHVCKMYKLQSSRNCIACTQNNHAIWYTLSFVADTDHFST